METAINVGYALSLKFQFSCKTVYCFCSDLLLSYSYACSLLREGMRKIVINIESNQAKASEKVSDKSAIYKVSLKASCKW